MKKFLFTLIVLVSYNFSTAQTKVLYSNVTQYTHSELVHLLTNNGYAQTLSYMQAIKETQDNPLVILDNGTINGSNVFNSMDDIREFITNLESFKKTGKYTTDLNYTLKKGPFKSVIAVIPDMGELFFTPYLVKQIKKNI